MASSTIALVPSPASFNGAPYLSELPAMPTDLPGTDIKRAPLDSFRIAIAQHVSSSLGVDLNAALVAVGTGKIGDYTVAVPRFKLPGKPNEISEKAAAAFQPNEFLSKVEAKGPFLHYFLNSKTLIKLTLQTVHVMTHGYGAPRDEQGNTQPSYGTNRDGEGKNIIVEFSSPNIAKPFHAGHLRSTIIGAFLSNLYKANAWNVAKYNYLGDWGKQFGLLAVGWKLFGDEQKLQEDAVNTLFDVYVRINKLASEEEDGKGEKIHDEARQFFKKMEDGDKEALALWQKFRDLSIKKYIEVYDRLNVQFDVYSGESQVTKENIVKSLDQLKTHDFVTREDNGALLADLSKYKLEKAVIERRDGTPLYITRDIAEAAQRFDKSFDGNGFDKMIYVVASQQDLHLAQFFKVLELMGYEWAQKETSRLQHINFGMILGMSTRKGTVVFLDNILDETRDKMHEVMRANEAKYAQVENPERTADIVGMTAVKIQDMASKRINNYNFDWSRMLSFEGDTGPYLQYNHVRLCSVERKAKESDNLELPTSDLDLSSINLDLIAEPKARDLVMLLAQWPDTVKAAMKDHQPSTIVTYAFRLTHLISSCWEFLLVKGQEKDLALARLFVFRCCKDVLGSALRLLTITPLDRM
ncbi:Arginyl-tRNA synthetase, class Ia, core [Kalmanozyma brasiliensis GHG001]|uniref:arginine--tRNA ligase n=1 Tax=Kalmanozyma brasiliensis (strain GHG001) TaxID=1365824 RepID=V5EQM6_KALBG|nr:Arginyl-tRNA synthetase, class Ia, core [Kalmanozyma brasiliensis GHG001]EST07450.1 Arginyl-tRNA synthetase, class Ia, core [Kalmanozyma brasiliensis GHG001]